MKTNVFHYTKIIVIPKLGMLFYNIYHSSYKAQMLITHNIMLISSSFVVIVFLLFVLVRPTSFSTHPSPPVSITTVLYIDGTQVDRSIHLIDL